MKNTTTSHNNTNRARRAAGTFERPASVACGDSKGIWRMALGPGFAVGPSDSVVDYVGRASLSC